MKKSLRRSRGLTLPELLIASAILSVLTTLVVSLIFNANRNQSMIAVQTNLKNASEMALYRMGKELAQAIKVFDEGAGMGPSFRSNLALNTAHPSMAKVLMPTIRDQGVQAPSITCAVDDTNFFWAPAVGNTLFFAELVETASFPGVALDRQRTVNIYRFDYYYINEPTSTDFSQP